METKNKIMLIILILAALGAGFFSGAILYRNSIPEKPLEIKTTKNFLKSSEILGLITSVVIQRMPKIIPKVILETDKTIVVEHPLPESRIHYLFFPKKDIKDIGKFSEEDKEYLVDLYSSIIEVIKLKKIKKYKILSNGPGRQHIAYLHIHLMAN